MNISPYIIEPYNAYCQDKNRKKTIQELLEEEQLIHLVLQEQENQRNQNLAISQKAQHAQQQSQNIAMASAGAGGHPPYTFFNLLPTIPVATEATNILVTSLTANWNPPSNAQVVYPSYQVDVATSSSFEAGTVVYNSLSVVAVNSALSDLIPITTYYYRVRAKSFAGVSGNSNIVSASTLIPSPLAPTNLTASDITNSFFTASWDSSSYSVAWPSSSLYPSFFYFLDVSVSSSFADFVNGFQNYSISSSDSVINEPLTGLSSSTEYYFRVRASNTTGTSSYSTTFSASTL